MGLSNYTHITVYVLIMHKNTESKAHNSGLVDNRDARTRKEEYCCAETQRKDILGHACLNINID